MDKIHITSDREIPSKKLDLSNKKFLYTKFQKKKPNGKYRIIYAPCEELKAEQKFLADTLSKHYNPPEYVFGFIPGRTCADAARLHTGKDWVITIDIKDFFPSITKQMLLDLGMREYWADVATLDGKLVQGSPASPVLSNLIFDMTDRLLHIYCDFNRITYSRYADDIVLSGMGKPKWAYVKYIEERLAILGMKINSKKIKFMFKNQEQKILGITVNKKVSINHRLRKELREKLRRETLTASDKGMIAYIKSVSEEQYNKLKS